MPAPDSPPAAPGVYPAPSATGYPATPDAPGVAPSNAPSPGFGPVPAGSPGYAPAPASSPAPSPPAFVQPSTFNASTAPTSYDSSSSSKSFSHGLQFVYANVETGYQRVGLRTLHTSNLLPQTVDSSGSGAFLGVGGGIQLVFLTVGPRFRTASLDAWHLWSLDIEAALRLPLGRVEPYFIFAGGYAKLDSSATGASGLPEVSVKGFNGRSGFGIDVFATNNITLGASGTLEILALSRSGSNLTQSPTASATACDAIADPVQKQQCLTTAVYDANGSSIGMAGTLSFVAGLHF